MDKTRWLSTEELHFWRSFLDTTSRALRDIEDRLKAESNLTFDDYEVLVHLSEAPERRLAMSELSDRLIHTRNRVSQRIDRMSAKGLVRREKCAEDARRVYAVLTEKGLVTITNAAPAHVATVRELVIDRLTQSDVQRGLEIFKKIDAPTPN